MKKRERISATMTLLLMMTAIFFDVFQAILTFAGGIGLIANRFISLFAMLSFGFWFVMLGVSLLNTRRLAVSITTSLGEMIPFIGTLPLWTIGIAALIAMVKLEDRTGVSITHKFK